MEKGGKTEVLEKPLQQAAWRERIRADLAGQVEAGGTLYGYRQDGAYVARTKSGDEIVTPGSSKRPIRPVKAFSRAGPR